MTNDLARQAGAHQTGEIEITEEMIEAAADAVLEYQFDMCAQEARGIAKAALEAALEAAILPAQIRDLLREPHEVPGIFRVGAQQIGVAKFIVGIIRQWDGRSGRIQHKRIFVCLPQHGIIADQRPIT